MSDDAGKAVGLHPAGFGPTVRSVLPRRSGHWVGAGLSVLLRGETLVIIAALFLVTIITMLTIKEAGTGMWLLLFSPIASSLLVAVCGSLFTLGVLNRRFRMRVVRVQLQRKHCPSCNYDLRSQFDRAVVIEGGDGDVVRCPECAACWSRSQLGAPVDSPPEVVVIRTGGNSESVRSEP